MNTADRLILVYNHFSSASSNKSMRKAWHNYLAIEDSRDQDDAVDVSALVLRELKSLEAALIRLKVPPPSYMEALAVLKAAWSPTKLENNWANFSDSLNRSGTLAVLYWASWAIKSQTPEENAVPEEMLADLLNQLQSQEELLLQTDLPAEIYAMLHRHIHELRSAVKYYKITGVKPIENVIHQQVGEIRDSKEIIVEQLKDSSVETKSAFAKSLEIIEKGGKLAEAGSKIFKFASEARRIGGVAWDNVLQALPNIPPTPPGG